MKFLKSLKAKFMLGLGAIGLASTNAMAAVTVDPSTGVMTGTIEVGPFMSGAAIVLTALAAFWAVRKVIGLFSR